MDQLKLAALDTDDLNIISGCVQDAVMTVGDLTFQPAEGRFMLTMNRFVWETAEDAQSKNYERRRSALHFSRVKGVKAHKIRQNAKEAVLELLAIQFEEQEAPGGSVTLHFAGGGAVRLDVECVEAQLSDLGPAWSTESRPEHPDD